jgi:hypothetical protein
MVGSDYTHRDPSMELEFRKELQARADKGDIPQSAVQKILYDNPKAFYGYRSLFGRCSICQLRVALCLRRERATTGG